MQSPKLRMNKARFWRYGFMGLTCHFAAASLFVASASAAALPPMNMIEENPSSNKICVQTMTSQAAFNLGYKDPQDLKIASFYAHYLKTQGRPDSAGAVAAILEASNQTGADFKLMVVQAMLESSLGEFNHPPVGSARGLFQFMPKTWLTLLSRYGTGFENGKYSDLIKKIELNNGSNVVDPLVIKKILDLRFDLNLSAYIKASQLKYEDRPVLKSILGHKPNNTDYYIAHVFGLSSSKRFLYHYKYNPDHVAADRLTKEARYNPSLFYNSNGRALSFKQVYENIDRKVQKRFGWLNDAIQITINSGQCVTPIKHQYTLSA